jgi:hypothetical protein
LAYWLKKLERQVYGTDLLLSYRLSSVAYLLHSREVGIKTKELVESWGNINRTKLTSRGTNYQPVCLSAVGLQHLQQFGLARIGF